MLGTLLAIIPPFALCVGCCALWGHGMPCPAHMLGAAISNHPCCHPDRAPFATRDLLLLPPLLLPSVPPPPFFPPALNNPALQFLQRIKRPSPTSRRLSIASQSSNAPASSRISTLQSASSAHTAATHRIPSPPQPAPASASPSQLSQTRASNHCTNGIAATGNTKSSRMLITCMHATHSRKCAVAKKFFVVPRMMLPTPACQ